MAGYYSGTIQKGSSGSDVTKWQQYLKSQGYDIAVDGIFGDKTKSITETYQKANGLGVDGIVGEKTWGNAGFSNINNPIAAPTVSAAPKLPNQNKTNYDDTYDGRIDKKAMDDALAAFNGYGSHTWGNQAINDQLLNEYLNRDPFSYDLNGDALYQQYKDKYIQQGKMAMQDTMGQAAAMTGGYGNSYAQSVGQQAYQNSLDNLNDIVPELYQMAYDRYNQQGQDMLNKLNVLDADYNRSYGEWETGYNVLRDKYGIASDNFYNAADLYNADRDTLNSLAQTKYQNEFNAWEVGNNNAWKEWEANEDARRWDIENGTKNSYVPTASDGTKYGLSKSYTKAINEEGGTKTTIVDKTGYSESAEDYADWSPSDWQGYFAGIRSTHGEQAAKDEYKRMMKAGLLPKDNRFMVNIASGVGTLFGGH